MAATGHAGRVLRDNPGMPWLELSLRCRATDEARLEAALEDLGALSVSLLDAADAENENAILEPGVGEIPLWPEITLLALFDENVESGPVAARHRSLG